MQIGNYRIVNYEYNNKDTGEMIEFTDFNQVKCEVNENDNTIKLWVPIEMLNRAHEVLAHCEHLLSHDEYNQLIDSELKDVLTKAEAILEYDFDELNLVLSSDIEINENPFEIRYPSLIGFESFYIDRYVDKDGEHTFGPTGAESGVFKKIEDELEEIYNFDAVEGDTIDTSAHKLYVYLEETESEE
jgi:hypothetical protein